jgi:hypothetical protein
MPGWRASPDTYFTTYLDPAVKHCIRKQIYCIIDWHYIARLPAATKIFRKVACHCGIIQD